MGQNYFLIACCALFLLTSAAPLVIPVGNEGKSVSISDNGQEISLDGLVFTLNKASPCSEDGGNRGGVEGEKGAAPGMTNAKAIYFLTNAAQNSVVALNVAEDGTLSDGSVTPTGGAGMTGVDSNGAPAVPDGLFSQGAIKVAGSNLLAVNPGSNTVSLFAIDSVDPTKLTLVGNPADTLGEFPMSVTVSTALKQACVANSGAKAGIACFSISASGLTALDTCLRPFAINQTTPPTGPLNTVSQTFFNADSTALLTTVKGDPTVNNTGFLSAFPVVNGAVSTEETRSSPPGTAVLFGTALLPQNRIFVTDASFGSATMSLSSTNNATLLVSTKIEGQTATCWATISDLTGSAFVTDVALNRLVEVDTENGSVIKETSSINGNPGMVDLVSAGRFLYALSPGNATVKSAVTVFDVSGGRGSAKEIQNFNPTGVSSSAQGMTFI